MLHPPLNPPNDVTHRLNPPKGPSFLGNTSFEPQSYGVKIVQQFDRHTRIIEKKR